jgi:hypothetical protein
MATQNLPVRILRAPLAAGSVLALLAACGSPEQAAPLPSPPAPSPEQAPVERPAGEGVTPPAAAPDVTPAPPGPPAPAQPAPDAPPPTEPSATPRPAAALEPALESMRMAQPSAKMSVPVDLRYSFDVEPLTNRPVTLHLAAVPRVAGSNLAVSLKAVEGVQVSAAGALNVQKAGANGTYRQQYSVTRQAGAPGELRVLVTMDLPQGSGFGFFSIPFEAGTNSQKQDLVKQP